jgi:hypothetical protein
VNFLRWQEYHRSGAGESVVDGATSQITIFSGKMDGADQSREAFRLRIWIPQQGSLPRTELFLGQTRARYPKFRAASDCLMPAKNRFFLRCSPRALGSFATGKLRVQTGATSFRAMLTTRSQNGNIAHKIFCDPSEKQFRWQILRFITNAKLILTGSKFERLNTFAKQRFLD